MMFTVYIFRTHVRFLRKNNPSKKIWHGREKPGEKVEKKSAQKSSRNQATKMLRNEKYLKMPSLHFRKKFSDQNAEFSLVVLFKNFYNFHHRFIS